MMSMLSRSSRSSMLTGSSGPCALSPVTSLYARSLMALDAALHEGSHMCFRPPMCWHSPYGLMP